MDSHCIQECGTSFSDPVVAVSGTDFESMSGVCSPFFFVNETASVHLLSGSQSVDVSDTSYERLSENNKTADAPLLADVCCYNENKETDVRCLEQLPSNNEIKSLMEGDPFESSEYSFHTNNLKFSSEHGMSKSSLNSAVIPCVTEDSSEEHSIFGCCQCNIAHIQNCPEHGITAIKHNPVRAVTSLPESLYLKPVTNGTIKTNNSEYGVFVNVPIHSGTRFGPVEGIKLNANKNVLNKMRKEKCIISVVKENGTVQMVEYENVSNWMRFVRHAETYWQQNLCLDQYGDELYFTAIKEILPSQELLAGYGLTYALKRKYKLLPGDPFESVAENYRNTEPSINNGDGPDIQNQRHMKRKRTLKSIKCCDDTTVNLTARCERGRRDKTGRKKKRTEQKKLTCQEKKGNDVKKYDCCGNINMSTNEYKNHINQQHKTENGLFRCPKCAKEKASMVALLRHVRETHSCQVYICAHCDVTFQSRKRLSSHVLKHVGIGLCLCPFCGLILSRSDKLKDHIIKIHEEKGSDETQTRQKISTSPTRKEAHAGREQALYECYECNLGYKKKCSLVHHIRVQHLFQNRCDVPEVKRTFKSVKQYRCPYCSKMYSEFCKRKNHILKKHPGKELPPKSRDKNKSIFIELDKHMVPYFCNVCGRTYSKRSNLLQHQRKGHNGIVAVTSNENIKNRKKLDTEYIHEVILEKTGEPLTKNIEKVQSDTEKIHEETLEKLREFIAQNAKEIHNDEQAEIHEIMKNTDKGLSLLSQFPIQVIRTGEEVSDGQEIEITIDAESLQVLQQSIQDGTAEIIDINQVPNDGTQNNNAINMDQYFRLLSIDGEVPSPSEEGSYSIVNVDNNILLQRILAACSSVTTS